MDTCTYSISFIKCNSGNIRKINVDEITEAILVMFHISGSHGSHRHAMIPTSD